LAPRETSIIYRQSQNIIKKRGKIITRGGTKPKPSKVDRKTKEANKNSKQTNRAGESAVRKATPITEKKSKGGKEPSTIPNNILDSTVIGRNRERFKEVVI